MNETEALERTYRRWLRWYPRAFRAEHEEEMLGVLLVGSPAGRRGIGPMARLDLICGGLGVRLRPRLPRSDRSAHVAIRLMVVGALVETAVALMVVTTSGNVLSSITIRDPGFTAAQWHAELTGRLEPLAIGSAAAVVLWLFMAWANGRGHRWAKILFAVFVATTTYSLLHGLAQGSATFARADLAVGLVMWLVELATLVALGRSEISRLAAARAAPGAALPASAAPFEETP